MLVGVNISYYVKNQLLTVHSSLGKDCPHPPTTTTGYYNKLHDSPTNTTQTLPNTGKWINTMLWFVLSKLSTNVDTRGMV